MNIASKKETIWNVCLLAVCILFYLLFPLCDGPVWCKDSESYVSMDISREPLYPIFLALCRICTGYSETGSLMAVVVIQSILAGFIAWYAGLVIKRMKNQSTLLQLAAIAFQFAAALLLSFLLISIRKQMLITLLIMGVVFGWYYLIRSKKIRKFCCMLGMMIIVFFACSFGTL